MARNNKGRNQTKVAVVRTSPQAVLADYATVMHLADYQKHMAAGSRNILKINLAWRHWYPAASTAPWQLDGVLQTLAADGYDTGGAGIVAGSEDAAWKHEAVIQNGLAAAAAGSGAGFMPQNEELMDGSNIIHLPVMKTHAGAGLDGAGMSVQQIFNPGYETVPGDLQEQIVDSLVLQQEVAAGVFTVMDGTLAGDGPGPRNLIPYEKNYLLAGADPVAVDAVAAHMMGFDPMEIGYIRIATERGIGQGDISRIKLVGEEIREVNFHFVGGRPEPMPQSAIQSAGSLFCGPPRAGLPFSEPYQEYLWYPFRGWPHIGRIAESEWGQLLQQYLPAGAELESQGSGKGPALAALAGVAVASLGAARLMTRRSKRGT